jgi:hypothetical protein
MFATILHYLWVVIVALFHYTWVAIVALLYYTLMVIVALLHYLWVATVSMLDHVWTLIAPNLDRLADQVSTTIAGSDKINLVALGVVFGGAVHAAREVFGLAFPMFRRHGFTRKIFHLAVALYALNFLNALAAFAVVALGALGSIYIAPYGDVLLGVMAFLVCCYIIYDLGARPTFHFANMLDFFVVPFLPGGALLWSRVAHDPALMSLITRVHL